MNRLLRICFISLLLLVVNRSVGQNLVSEVPYELSDTTHIRKILSSNISFTEEHIDTLAKRLQRIYFRADELDFWWGRMKASSLLGMTYGAAGNVELSLTNFTRAIEIANEKEGFNTLLPQIYILLTDYYRQWGDYSKMPELLEKSEQYVNFYKNEYPGDDLNNRLLDIYSSRARAYAGMRQISKAEEAVKMAVQIKTKNNTELTPDQMLKINLTRFYIFYSSGKYDSCEKLLLQNIAIANKLDGHSNGRFNAFPRLADLYVKMKQYQKAYRYADSSRLIVAYDVNLARQLTLHKSLLVADSATGNVQKLVSRYKVMQALNDTLNKRNRLSSAAYYQTELDIQTHINALKQKEEESKNKSVTIVLAIAIGLTASVLLSVIVFLIWRHNKKTEQNVLELSRLNQEIKSKHADMMIAFSSLEKSHEDNRQLIKVVAHDLRNPLASSMRHLEYIEGEEKSNSEISRAIDTIKTNTVNSLGLIDDLLHDKGKLEETNIEMVELHAILQYCVNLLKEKATEKNQKIELKTEPVSLLIDREKIWRVMSNLIYNAIKFSPAGSKIFVQIKQEKDKVLTIIKDNGIGIPESFRKDIFDMFTPSQRLGTNGEESFGMGLAVSKNIIEAHNGRIWFESVEGKGTTFFVELPLSVSEGILAAKRF